MKKVQSLLRVWKMRNLTFYGKITIIKTIIVSQFVYIATCLTIPKHILTLLNKLLYSFLWGSKKEKVKRIVVTRNLMNWGLGMVNLRAKFLSLQLSWFSKYLNGGKCQWRLLFAFWIGIIGDVPEVLRINCSSKDMF